jgi:hypothetical protein
MGSRDGAKGFAGDFRTFLGIPTLEQAAAHRAVAREEVHDTVAAAKRDAEPSSAMMSSQSCMVWR